MVDMDMVDMDMVNTDMVDMDIECKSGLGEKVGRMKKWQSEKVAE